MPWVGKAMDRRRNARIARELLAKSHDEARAAADKEAMQRMRRNADKPRRADRDVRSRDAIERWKANPLPIGAKVIVRLDDGSDWATTTRSEPWLLGDGTPVIKLEGKSGGYLLERVRPA